MQIARLHAGEKCRERHEGAIGRINQEEKNHVGHVHEIEHYRQNHRGDAKQLDERREQLVHEKVGVRQKTHQAEAQVGEHAPMLGHAFEQTAMPPAPLLDEIAQGGRRLAPAYGFGRVLDQVIAAGVFPYFASSIDIRRSPYFRANLGISEF